MNRDKIVYSESVETVHGMGLRRWRRAEVSATIDQSDNPLDCLAELKKDVQTFLQSPPEVSVEEALGGVLPVQQVENRIGLLAKDIMSCEDLVVLDSYKILVKGKPELQQAFDKRLQQLQSPSPPATTTKYLNS